MVIRIKRYIRPAGSPIRPVYKLKISKETGAQELVQVGKENWQEYIDSFASSCDLAVIIARVNAGELDLLSKNIGSYGDFTKVPESKAEMMQQFIDSKRMYDSLSPDQRTKFTDFEDFCSNAGTVDWLEKLGYDVSSVKDEVDNNESK